MKIEPGQILLEKYRVDTVLGRGGMGIVVKIHHLIFDEPFALKVLRHDIDDGEQLIKRFLREARTALKLLDEHVCRVFDVGILDDGCPYMVLEYLHGMTLSEYVKRYGQLPVATAVGFILQACQALIEAHQVGIVHRDLKPANLFVTERPDGRTLLKVLDFGISKLQSDIDEEITHTHAVLGTPAYMSPEQLQSAKHVDARTDIWALGVVLYELLGGRRPFTGRSYSSLCVQVSVQPVPPLQTPLPSGLAAIVTRCLAKNPDERFESVAELATALAPYANPPPHRVVDSTHAPAVNGPADASTQQRMASAGSAETWSTVGESAGQQTAQPAGHVSSSGFQTGAGTRPSSLRSRVQRIGLIALLCSITVVAVGLFVIPADDAGDERHLGAYGSDTSDAGLDGNGGHIQGVASAHNGIPASDAGLLKIAVDASVGVLGDTVADSETFTGSPAFEQRAHTEDEVNTESASGHTTGGEAEARASVAPEDDSASVPDSSRKPSRTRRRHVSEQSQRHPTPRTDKENHAEKLHRNDSILDRHE